MTGGAPPAEAFQAGGPVRQGNLYVRRPADEELPAALLDGKLCYVLAPRQMGKSSLMVRTMGALRQQGLRAVDVDLTGMSTGCNEYVWYRGLLDEIADQLELDADLDAFMKETGDLSVVHRWSRFLHRVLLEEVAEPVVIFIDEIDSVLALPFSNDDFFASIRAAYNQRAGNPAFERLNFCLLGVAAPADLMRDRHRTPFNIGRPVALDDFTAEEARAVLPALAALDDEPEALLEAVLAWTDGHPYLTQLLGDHLAKAGDDEMQVAGTPAERVERIVREVFFEPGASLETNLETAQERLLRAGAAAPGMLALYRRVWTGSDVPTDDRDTDQLALRLTGMVATRITDGEMRLRVRNRIFAETFDLAWIQTQEERRPFTEALARWLGADRGDDFVLRGQALEEARAWARERQDLTPEESAFLMQGLEVARRHEEERAAAILLDKERLAAGRLRWMVLVVSIALVLTSVAAIVAWRQKRQAESNAERARTEAARAERNAERAREEAERAKSNDERAREETARAESNDERAREETARAESNAELARHRQDQNLRYGEQVNTLRDQLQKVQEDQAWAQRLMEESQRQLTKERDEESARAETAEAQRARVQVQLVQIQEHLEQAEVSIWNLSRKPVFQDCPECPEMVVVPAGQFTMGSAEDEVGRYDDEGPQHLVTISPFAIGKYEITVREFAASGLKTSECAPLPQMEADPVACVSWHDAKRYVEWLSRETHHEYRLPSEAEWEYAARGGTTTARFWGDDPDYACIYANVADRSAKKKNRSLTRHKCDDGYIDVAPVGSFQPNRFGLYDTLGNVWEWTEDCGNRIYERASTDGSVRTESDCTEHVIRGGSWIDEPRAVRSAFRYGFDVSALDEKIGFRVIRTLLHSGS